MAWNNAFLSKIEMRARYELALLARCKFAHSFIPFDITVKYLFCIYLYKRLFCQLICRDVDSNFLISVPISSGHLSVSLSPFETAFTLLSIKNGFKYFIEKKNKRFALSYTYVYLHSLPTISFEFSLTSS